MATHEEHALALVPALLHAKDQDLNGTGDGGGAFGSDGAALEAAVAMAIVSELHESHGEDGLAELTAKTVAYGAVLVLRRVCSDAGIDLTDRLQQVMETGPGVHDGTDGEKAAKRRWLTR